MQGSELNSAQMRSDFIAITIGLLVFTSCRNSENNSPHQGEDLKQKEQQEQTLSKAAPVEVEYLQRGSISDKLKAVAVVRAKERASVRSLISGLVTELYVEEGSSVQKDQKLAKLSRPGASSLIQKAQSAYQKSRRDVEQITSLVQRGLAPREELAQAKFNRDQSGLELMRLREESKNETLRSPISGVIIKRAVYRGEVVSPGQLIFDLIDLSKLYVPLQLPDRWANRVRIGMKATLSDRSGKTLAVDASVTHVSPVIDADSGTFTVWISPKNSTARKSSNESGRGGDNVLKPGLFVSAEITLDEKPDALLISRDAVVYKDGEPTVTSIAQDAAKTVRIELGYQESERVEILSPLAEGTPIITFGQRGLEEGAPVRVVDSDPTLNFNKKQDPSERLKR